MTFVKSSPAAGKVLESMASLPSSRRALQWAGSPPQVLSSASLTGAEEDDAEESLFPGPSLVSTSQCMIFRTSPSQSAWDISNLFRMTAFCGDFVCTLTTCIKLPTSIHHNNNNYHNFLDDSPENNLISSQLQPLSSTTQ